MAANHWRIVVNIKTWLLKMPRKVPPDVYKARRQQKLAMLQSKKRRALISLKFCNKAISDSNTPEQDNRRTQLLVRIEKYDAQLRELNHGILPALGYDKDHSYDRYIYALIFADERCYIGQSINPRRRFRQHATVEGWEEDFETLILDHTFGNYWDAGFLEYAWRWVAHRAGWRTYSAPGIYSESLDVVVRDGAKRHALSLSWPFGPA